MKQRIYRGNIIYLLQELASKDYQVNIWLNINNPNNLSASFDEAINMLFDDSIITDLLEDNEIIFDQKTTQAFRELSNAVDLVEGYRKPEEIISDPLMQIVRDKAAEVLRLISISDESESTVDIIEEPTMLA